VIEEAMAEGGGYLKDYTVLAEQADPFRLVLKPGSEILGAWFAGWHDRVPERARGHLRDFHYAIASGFKDPKRADGTTPYVNDGDSWDYLLEASTAARWLGKVAFDAFEDKKSQPPIIEVFWEPDRTPWLDIGLDIEIPDVADINPRVDANFTANQPYRIILFGEKAGLEIDLRPIAQRYGGALFLCEGDIGYGPVYKMAKLGLDERRPIIVLTFCDCDPSGWNMPIAIAHKLRAFKALHPDLEFQVHRVALTPDQVRKYELPSAPLKPIEKEKRGDKWRAAMGTEQTEINSLYVIRPGVLRQLARDAIAPFFDETLARRSAEAREEWRARAQAVVDANLDQDQLAQVRVEATEKLEAIRAEVDRLKSALRVDVTYGDLPEIVVPEAEVDGAQPLGLADSAWSFAEHCRRLKDSKEYRS
jgi:hypothetical protein